jgi:hypothetical protein
MEREKASSWIFACMGYLTKVNVPACKKRKLGPKTVDCVFLGYAHNSAAYRFLVIKSEFSDVHVNTLTVSRDDTFFKEIFPMKDRVAIPSEASTSSVPQPIHFLYLLFILNNPLRITVLMPLEGARDK